MLYDKDLAVPDKASAVQLEKRFKAKVANPFNMKKLREAAKEQAKVEPPAQIWNPQIQVGKRITPAAPAVNPPPFLQLVVPVIYCSYASFPAGACYAGGGHCAGGSSS